MLHRLVAFHFFAKLDKCKYLEQNKDIHITDNLSQQQK